MRFEFGSIDPLQLIIALVAVVAAYFRLRSRGDQHARESETRDNTLDAKISLLNQRVTSAEDQTKERFDFIKDALDQIRKSVEKLGDRK